MHESLHYCTHSSTTVICNRSIPPFTVATSSFVWTRNEWAMLVTFWLVRLFMKARAAPLRYHKHTLRVNCWEGFARTSGIYMTIYLDNLDISVMIYPGTRYIYVVQDLSTMYILRSIYPTREMRPRSCRVHGTKPRVQEVLAPLPKHPKYLKYSDHPEC